MVYNAEYQAIEEPRCFEHLGEGESVGIDVYYREGKECKAIRLCAVRKREEEGTGRDEPEEKSRQRAEWGTDSEQPVCDSGNIPQRGVSDPPDPPLTTQRMA
jgi:hypothetical protein